MRRKRRNNHSDDQWRQQKQRKKLFTKTSLIIYCNAQNCFVVDRNQHLLHNSYQDSRGNYVLKYYFVTDTQCEKHWEEKRWMKDIWKCANEKTGKNSSTTVSECLNLVFSLSAVALFLFFFCKQNQQTKQRTRKYCEIS